MVSKIDSSGLRRFLILLYKGLLLRKRHYIITAFELVFPVVIASIPAIIQSEAGIPSQKSLLDSSLEIPGWVNDTIYSPFNPFSSGPDQFSSTVLFAYAPSNNNTDMLIEDSVQLWKSHHNNTGIKTEIESFKDADDLENYCMTKQREDSKMLIIGTVFNNIPPMNLPPGLDYTIRSSHIYSFMGSFATNLKYRFSESVSDDAYSKLSYFLSWQASVEKTFIKKKMVENNENFDYEISMQQFPSPGHKMKNIRFNLAVLIPSMVTYGLFIFVVNIMRRVIEEKSNGSKELLKMMGMTDFIYWSSTFMNYFIVGAVVFAIITIVYKFPLKNATVLLEYSNGLLLFIIFLLFVSSLILFCLALTIFFNKAIFGVIVLIIVYTICFALLSAFVFVPEKVEISYYSLSLLVKLCICMLPPGAILTISEILVSYETSGEGLQWHNLYSYNAIPDMNMFIIMLTLLFSCIFYSLMIWYIDAVWPWQYGVPKPFYFPFTKTYWFGYQEKKVDEILLDVDEPKNSEFFEDEPTGISPGVVIHNLSKVFRTGLQTKVAVNDVSLNFYSGQITALLGHNGAGKTTTINILTGLYPPSSGTASVNGWDIFTHTTKARLSLGVCPQHNVLYDTLTVEEHLKIYAALKGVSWNRLNQEAQNIINMLHLTDKKSELIKNLSGGMKRKLSLGIALIGGSKVLFLDEPTSGMDVEARRSVWDALLDLRHNHTIILTTHYMEEADILGDRIAIMTDGEIQCCGSSLFLKKKFGTGYHLHVVKNENFDLNALNDLLAKHVPSATLENEFDEEVAFNFMSNTHSTNFGSLFEEIEHNKDTLGINSCGITITTMEDVFLNVAHIADLKMNTEENLNLDNENEIEMKDIYIESNDSGKSQKFKYQFYGLFLKRLHYAKRYWSVLISQIILPFAVMCICLSFISSTSFKSSLSLPSLNLDIEKVYGRTDSFYMSDSESQSIAEHIKIVLQDRKVNVKFVDNPEQFVLNYGKKSIADYYKCLIVGGSAVMNNSNFSLTAWFNGFPYHAEPMSLLLMDTAILRYVSKTGYISLTNDPLPDADSYYFEDPMYTKERILGNVFVPLALSFLSSSFVLIPIHERISKAKLLQMMTGVSSVTYWLAMFVWDFFTNTIVSFLLIIPFAIFSRHAFFSPHFEAIGTALLIMILYGWSSIPFSYLFSLIFKKPNSGFSVVNAVCVITGIVVCSIFTVIVKLPGVSGNKTVIVFSWLLKIFPSYALSSGFSNLFGIAYSNAYCETLSPKDLKYNCVNKTYNNPVLKCCKDICGDNCLIQTYPITWKEDACGRDILFLFLDGIIYFLLLLLLESSCIKSLISACMQCLSMLRKAAVNEFAASSVIEDLDVLNEENRVKDNYEQLSHNDALVVLNLSKQFSKLRAVDGLTFSIHKKECFGLLGVNGAGKTTTFRMLTGDCYPTEGNAYIGNYSVLDHLKKFQSHIGYCPQFDALIDRLSAREIITLFARLRGLHGPNMTRYVNTLIKMTDLSKYAEKPSMVYSGGNKRKLSIALALVGSPPLLLLDEPTAGVDPVSRRKIWKILSLARSYSGAAVILTTHSMEECEALCSRLAIMVNGRFRCLGSIQRLKSKFGQGYTLIIKIKKEEESILQSMNTAKEYIDTNLQGAHLKDDHQGMLQYHVVNPSVTLSHLFKFMDDMKKKCNLEDYVISDTSLEQIFLAFARSQRYVST